MKQLILASATCLLASNLYAEPPRLVVQIVVDQLRSDILPRYQDNFSDKGFNRLIAHSIDYRNASHNHANTVTCVGHATIATGAPPAYHGIIANHWYDRSSKQRVYCAGDPQHLQLSQSTKKRVGRSPKWLTTTTLSDQWVSSGLGQAYAVSYKDRASIMLAGHSGKAYWFDKNTAQVTTSTFYHRKLPAWAAQWNQQLPAKAYKWKLSHQKSYYHNQNSPRFTNRFPGFREAFPHLTGQPKDRYYGKYLSMTPVADHLTNQFAISLIKHKQLGSRENHSDYLAISFSGNDAIGHQFGPNSLECEENLYALDHEIAQLLDVIDKQVGLDKTIIILTADHGIKNSAANLKANHLKSDRQDESQIVRHKIIALLKQNWQLNAKALQYLESPYVYLNHEYIQQKHLNIVIVKETLARQLNASPPIFRALTMPMTHAPIDDLNQLIMAMSVPLRSGDLYMVPYPNHVLGNYEDAKVMHGSPWQNDRDVPLYVFNGQWLHKAIHRPVASLDIAPTISQLMNIQKPLASTGVPLTEVFKK